MQHFRARNAYQQLQQDGLILKRARRSNCANRTATLAQHNFDRRHSSTSAGVSLEEQLQSLEAKEERAASAIKSKATKEKKRQAALLAASLPPRVGLSAFEPHRDLTTYSEHVVRNQISTTSTVHKGTLYEYTVAESLKQYGMNLRRVGKANDFGIDLIGTWNLPQGLTLRMFLQCKLTRGAPAYIRELEGAYTGAPTGWDTQQTLAILASRHAATRGSQLAVQRSSSPLGMIQIDANGCVKQFIWNHVANDLGLAEVGVTSMHEDHARDAAADVTLTWQHKRWPTFEG